MQLLDEIESSVKLIEIPLNEKNFKTYTRCDNEHMHAFSPED